MLLQQSQVRIPQARGKEKTPKLPDQQKLVLLFIEGGKSVLAASTFDLARKLMASDYAKGLKLDVGHVRDQIEIHVRKKTGARIVRTSSPCGRGQYAGVQR